MNGQLLIEKKKSFGIYESALASLLFIIYNFLYLQLYSFLPQSFRANIIVYFIASFLLEFMFALTAITVAAARKVKIKEASGMNKKVSGNLVFYCFLLSIVCLLGFGNLTSVFLEFLELLGYSSVLSNLVINTFWQYLFYVLVSCITPAVCEELLFRGVIASGLKKFGFMVALIVSSIIFTLMHGNAEQTVHQFIIGLVVGYIFLKTGNLWLSILVHFFNNFISVTEYYILNLIIQNSNIGSTSGEIIVTTSTINPWLQLVIDLVVALIFAGIAFLLVKSLTRSLIKENERVNGEKPAQSETPILVDGEQTQTVMMVDGKVVEEQTTAENLTEEKSNQNSNEEKKTLSAPVIVLFSLSFAYLAFDWILSLLQGFGVL